MAEKQSGALPPEEVIILESTPEQWELFEKGLTTQLDITGLIEKDDQKLRIQIEIAQVYSPQTSQMQTIIASHTSNFETMSQAKGYIRARDFFHNLMNKSTWILIGYIKGKNKIPLIIVHFEMLKLSVYAQKLLGEDTTFLPGDICMN